MFWVHKFWSRGSDQEGWWWGMLSRVHCQVSEPEVRVTIMWPRPQNQPSLHLWACTVWPSFKASGTAFMPLCWRKGMPAKRQLFRMPCVENSGLHVQVHSAIVICLSANYPICLSGDGTPVPLHGDERLRLTPICCSLVGLPSLRALWTAGIGHSRFCYFPFYTPLISPEETQCVHWFSLEKHYV